MMPVLMIWRGRAPGGQRGSMAVEFVILVPAFLLLLLLVAAGGDWVSAAGQVGAAASDAARAASVARTWQQAQSEAQSAAGSDLTGACPGGLTTTMSPDTDAAFTTAADVQVTVSCTLNLQAFAVLGFDSGTTFTRTAVAPLDQFVERS